MMAEEYILEATDYTPLCKITTENRSILLSGVSMPENANEFYLPIIEAVDNLFENSSNDFTLTVDFSYMNSMSNKQVLRLMKHLESKLFKLKVIWKFRADDELMKTKGEELKRICKTITIEVEQLN